MGGSLDTTVLENAVGGANCLCDGTCRFRGSEDSYYGLLVYEAVWVPSLGAKCLLLPVWTAHRQYVCCFQCEQHTDNISAASSMNSVQTICLLLPVWTAYRQYVCCFQCEQRTNNMPPKRWRPPNNLHSSIAQNQVYIYIYPKLFVKEGTTAPHPSQQLKYAEPVIWAKNHTASIKRVSKPMKRQDNPNSVVPCKYPRELLQFMGVFAVAYLNMGTAVAQWLRCCATNRKVAGLIPVGVCGFFIDIILPIALWPWGRLSL